MVTPPRASGGIGRRTGFRFRRGDTWRFESSLAHNSETIGETQTSPGQGDAVHFGGDESGDDLRARRARERLVVRLCRSLAELINARDAKAVAVVASAIRGLRDLAVDAENDSVLPNHR